MASRQAGGEQVVLSVDTLEPGSVDGWAAYPAGVAWALREAGYLPGGADVAIDADLPAQDDAERAADRTDNGRDPHRPAGTPRRCGQ